MALHHTVPKGLCAAFYKGNRPGIDGFYNRLGRYLDHGSYSHTELVFSNGLSASASLLDGGVRFKEIGFSSVGNWDFMLIPDPTGDIEAKAFRWFVEHEGKAYDWLGNLRFMTNMARDDPEKWFCSESLMSSQGFPEAFRHGPSGAASTMQFYYKTPIIEVSA